MPLGRQREQGSGKQPRANQEHECHHWRMGVRPGPDADDSRAQKADSVLPTPPGVRKTSVREPIAFLQANGQMGFPRPKSTDASLGYPVIEGTLRKPGERKVHLGAS